MQGNIQKEHSPDQDSYSEMDQDFFTNLNLTEREENEALEEEEVEEEEEEEEFSFMCDGADTSPIAAEDAFINGQIKPVFPLFNRDLLLSGEELQENLPMKPPVKRVFVETNEGQSTSSPPEDDEIVGPYCEWSNRKAVEMSPEVCKKSNSTGFSKIWRFKDFIGRSNSDGRDAFVFLNNNHAPPRAAEKVVAAAMEVEKVEKVVTTAKASGKVKKKSVKGKTASLSAHEVYLKSKAKDSERRRSYLPYRPELMGFFTNVNGGMTKNVHPF